MPDFLADPSAGGHIIRESLWHSGAVKQGLPGVILSGCSPTSFR